MRAVSLPQTTQRTPPPAADVFSPTGPSETTDGLSFPPLPPSPSAPPAHVLHPAPGCAKAPTTTAKHVSPPPAAASGVGSDLDLLVPVTRALASKTVAVAMSDDDVKKQVDVLFAHLSPTALRDLRDAHLGDLYTKTFPLCQTFFAAFASAPRDTLRTFLVKVREMQSWAPKASQTDVQAMKELIQERAIVNAAISRADACYLAGQIAQAVALLRRFVDPKRDAMPADLPLRVRLLTKWYHVQVYNPQATPTEVKEAIAQEGLWRRALRQNSMTPAAGTRTRAGDARKGDARPLNVALVSPDYRTTALSSFFSPSVVACLLADKRFSYHAYSTCHKQAWDRRTLAYAQLFGSNFVLLNESASPFRDLSKQFRHDEIDILVDLVGIMDGWSDGFLQQDACDVRGPVKVTMLGSPVTSGRDGFFRITDRRAEPADAAEHFSEELLYLREKRPETDSGGGDAPRSLWCYEPLLPKDVIAALRTQKLPPCLRREDEMVTFACLQRACKINDEVLVQYAALLARVKNSRLVVRARSAPQGQLLQQRLEGFLQAAKVDPDRAEVRANSLGYAAYLRFLHDEIDVNLDTWPYNGTTTTCDAMTMGVLTVGCGKEDRHMARVSGAIFEEVRRHLDQQIFSPEEMDLLTRPNLAAEDAETFLRTTEQLAARPELLQKLRTGLPEALAQSQCGDPQGYAQALGDTLLHAWAKAQPASLSPTDVAQVLREHVRS